jgi:hypothetical protein
MRIGVTLWNDFASLLTKTIAGILDRHLDRNFGSKFWGKVGLFGCVLEQLCDYDATSGVDEQ